MRYFLVFFLLGAIAVAADLPTSVSGDGWRGAAYSLVGAFVLGGSALSLLFVGMAEIFRCSWQSARIASHVMKEGPIDPSNPALPSWRIFLIVFRGDVLADYDWTTIRGRRFYRVPWRERSELLAERPF